MLAFHAPPDAVTKPVTKYGKIAGKNSSFHRAHSEKWNTLQTSFKSAGIAVAPAITLNRMYHWVPNSSSTMDPIPSPPPARININNMIGNKAVAGTDAA